MWEESVLEVLKKIKEHNIQPEEGYKEIKDIISGKLGFAELDLLRPVRTGFPEVVFCQNKEDKDILEITKVLKENNKVILLTRARDSVYNMLKNSFSEIKYYKRSKAITIGTQTEEEGLVTVVSAGTADIPVAEEAFITARIMGARVNQYWDIGIAGIHRLFFKLDSLRKSRVIIAVAGMEGALPGVIAGLTSCPIIAVPTSVGYGTGTGGFAALLSMLNTCAPGVAVVNIDNGFGAGYIASLINRQADKYVVD